MAKDKVRAGYGNGRGLRKSETRGIFTIPLKRNCIRSCADDAHRRPVAARFVHACTPKCVGIDSNGISRSQEPRYLPAAFFDVFSTT